MKKYIVLTPFVNFSPSLRQYTQGDEYVPADAGEAERMVAAGILKSDGGKADASPVETADAPPVAAETADKPAPRKKGA